MMMGIWPTACVEQDRHGSCARTAASTRFNMPSCTTGPLMYVLATLSTASVIAQLLCPVETIRLTLVNWPFSFA